MEKLNSHSSNVSNEDGQQFQIYFVTSKNANVPLNLDLGELNFYFAATIQEMPDQT